MENNQILPIEEKGEIVLYQPDDNVRLEVRNAYELMDV